MRLKPFNRRKGSLSAKRYHLNQRRFVAILMVPSHGNFSNFSPVLIARAVSSNAISQWLPDHLRITSESDAEPISLIKLMPISRSKHPVRFVELNAHAATDFHRFEYMNSKMNQPCNPGN